MVNVQRHDCFDKISFIIITDFAKSFKKAELFKSRDQVYKPEHMVQSAPVVEVAQEPLVEEPTVTEPEVQKPTEPEVQETTVEVVEPTEPVAPEQTSLFESEGKPEAEAFFRHLGVPLKP